MAAVFAAVPRADLEAAAARVGELAEGTTEQALERLLTRYAHVRRFLPDLLAKVPFAGGEAAEPVLEGLTFLRAHEGRRVLKHTEIPEAVVGRSWRPLVFSGSGRVDKRAYTFCVLDQLRRGLRRHDIYVPGSRRWADPRAQLLRGAAWESARSHASRALNLSEDGAAQVASMARQLDAAYRRTVANLPNNAAVTIERVGDESIVSLSPLEKQEDPASLAELRAEVAARLPQVDLPDLLLEVANWTGFAREFTHVSEAQSRAVDIDVSICAVLLAEACNIGLEPLAQAEVPALAPDRLAWVAQNYVRAETIARANARLVDYHAGLPLVQAWGGGEVASADGLRFTVPVRTVHAGHNSRYFGS
ncbi:MAG TPA: Tn3 family transposase, partial [Myxococcota bacterium]|nr:Tn3 family transposase [Myxococcota bacterium]